MSLYKNILDRRTIRLFQNKKISRDILKKLINAARLAPSARNLQPLEYLVVNDSRLCDKIFDNVVFGGETEKLRTKENRPVAYVLVLVNKDIRQQGFEHDAGLAASNIILAAQEEGIGACLMGAIDRQNLVKELNIPLNYYLDLVIALGYPAENPGVKEAKSGSYWRNEKGELLVVKKPLSQILHWNMLKRN